MIIITQENLASLAIFAFCKVIKKSEISSQSWIEQELIWTNTTLLMREFKNIIKIPLIKYHYKSTSISFFVVFIITFIVIVVWSIKH